MIFVNNNWVIGVDAYNYSVARNKKVVQKRKDGAEIESYPWEGYFTSLENAIDYIIRENQRLNLKSGDMTLVEALQTIRESNKEIMAAVKAATGENV